MRPSPSAVDRLIVLLEQLGANDPDVRQVTALLRRTPKVIAEQFDQYQNLVDAVGAGQAAHIVINATLVANRGWLPG